MATAREILQETHARFLRRDLDGVIDLVADDLVIVVDPAQV